MLEKFSKDNSSMVKTLLDVNFHLSKNKKHFVFQVEYSKVVRSILSKKEKKKAIGSLMYLKSHTRSNIIYIVSKLNRYTSNLSNDHCKGIVRILRYL